MVEGKRERDEDKESKNYGGKDDGQADGKTVGGRGRELCKARSGQTSEDSRGGNARQLG